MENEATLDTGAEQIQTEQPQGEADAGLLEAYLAQETEGQQDAGDSDGTPAQSEQPQQDDGLFTVKIDGTEKRVSKDELITSYQKDQASNKRFEEAAQVRQQAEAQMREYQSQQQMLSKAIEHFTGITERLNIQPPDMRLLEQNPQEYLRQDAIYRQYQSDMQKAEAAKAYLTEQQQLQQSQMMQEHLAREGQQLLKVIPEWSNAEIRTKEQQGIVKYLGDLGYSQADIAELNGSSATNIAVVRKAMMYDQLVAKSKTATQQVQKLPPRMEKPGVQQQSNGNKDEAMRRLGKTGRVEDAAAVLAAMFA